MARRGEDRGEQEKGNDNSRDYAEMRGVAFVRKREKEKKKEMPLNEVYIRAAPAAAAAYRLKTRVLKYARPS